MAMGTYYLDLAQVPMTFDPLDQTKGAFFDQNNFQMFCVQQGFTTVKIKGLGENDNFQLTIPPRGPVKTIKLSGGSPKILSIQTRNTSVEFVNLSSSDFREQSLPSKNHNFDILGFHWVFHNEFLVLITTSTVEFYQFIQKNFIFKLLKTFSLNATWAIYSSTEKLLVVGVKSGTVLHPFSFRSGVSLPMIRHPKIEIELGASRETKPTVKERDVFIMNLYGTQYISIIRTSPQGPGVGSEIILYQLSQDGQSKLTHVCVVDIPGRCTLSVVDNLIVVHHQSSKTSMIYDISFGGKINGSVTSHSAVLAPLPIAPCTLLIRKKGEDMPKTPSPRIIMDQSTQSRELGSGEVQAVNPELYSSKWIFFQPDIVIDAHFGVIWKLKINLMSLSNMIADKISLVQLLLMRTGGKNVILEVCRECLEPGRQVNLAVIGAIFDYLNNAYKLLGGSASDLLPGRRYRNAIGQREMYTQVLAPLSDKPEMAYNFMVAVTIEFIRSLHKFQIPVEHFLFELIMNLLIENKCFYQLHQFLQYHVISDSKPLATLLLSKELVYPPSTQLAMDMFKRLGTADSEITDILISRGQILSALQFVKASDKVDTVSARVFLEAAANEDDRMLFYTVYKFFEERNLRLRKKPEFPPDEKCQQYEKLYRHWFQDQ